MAQVGNLIVTGSSKHLNTIYGSNLVIGTLKSGTTLGAHATVFGDDNEASNFYDHAEGYQTTASGGASHAEGVLTTANSYYAHAEGYNTTAGAVSAHAEGDSTTASGLNSHAEGYKTTANSYYAHAEGNQTTASGYGAHAEGILTTASGYYSHAEGAGTTATHNSQHVFGQYNILDPSPASVSRGTYIEIVGNGTDTTKSNARTLDWSGNEWLAGNLILGGTTSDITLNGTNNTWDGINTSLKSALNVPYGMINFCVNSGSDTFEICDVPSDIDDYPLGYWPVNLNFFMTYIAQSTKQYAGGSYCSVITYNSGTWGYQKLYELTNNASFVNVIYPELYVTNNKVKLRIHNGDSQSNVQGTVSIMLGRQI